LSPQRYRAFRHFHHLKLSPFHELFEIISKAYLGVNAQDPTYVQPKYMRLVIPLTKVSIFPVCAHTIILPYRWKRPVNAGPKERKEAKPSGNLVSRSAGESPARPKLEPGKPKVSLAAQWETGVLMFRY
jgi:hypothetical protein